MHGSGFEERGFPSASMIERFAVSCSQAMAPDSSSPRLRQPDRHSGRAPADWRTVLDVISLPQSRVLQRGSLDEETGRRFSKFGLVIRADEQFMITVVEGARPNALIGWSNGTTNEPVQSIVVPGCSGLCETDWQPDCPLGESGAWVVYPGGVWTEERTCLAIEIAAGDRVVTAELPIGTECT